MDDSFININNYHTHPTNKSYKVFKFTNAKMAESFEMGLINQSIEYEKDTEDRNNKTFYLFAIRIIRRKELDRVLKINNMAKGLHRDRTIKNKTVANIILLFTGLIILLALIGYFTSKQ